MIEVLSALACLVVSLIVGMGICVSFLRGGTQHWSYGYFLSISFGIGIGILSQAQLIWTVVGLNGNLRWSLDLALTGIAVARIFQCRERLLLRKQNPNAGCSSPPPLHKAAYGWSIVVFATSIYVALRQGYSLPYGTGDAVTNWYPKARFLFSSEPGQWRNLFSAHFPHWMHADYPLLLPLSLVRGWSYTGNITFIYPIAMHSANLAATFGLLYFTLNRTHGPVIAAMGLTLFSAMPGVYYFNSLQYADGFFMYYVLAITSLAVHDVSDSGKAYPGLMLLGMACGFASWTKNEGWLLMIAVCGAFALACALRRRTAGDLKQLTLGIATSAAMPLAYKLFYAPANDIINGSTLFDPLTFSQLGSRIEFLLARTPSAIFDFGFWYITPTSLIIVGILSFNKILPRLIVNAELFTILVITIFGYCTALLLVPQDYNYEWFVNFSLSRIYFQIFPSLILLAVLLGFSRNREGIWPAEISFRRRSSRL
ncbi:hypothetical protein [Achromobacter kerstersii]